MKRTVRKIVDAGLPILGTIVVFAAVLLVIDTTVQILVVLIGLLMIDAGIWKLTHPLLPSTRQFTALRAEVDAFIVRVRRLNAAAIARKGATSPEGEEQFRQAVAELHASIDRMERYAGRTDDELANVRPGTPVA